MVIKVFKVGICTILFIAAFGGLFFKVSINLSESLPYDYVLTLKFIEPKKGELVLFKAPPTAFPNLTHKPDFTKIVLGETGDVVAVQKRVVKIGGLSLQAKERAKSGRALEMISAGVIPQDKMFVFTPHIDSYDSRYAEVGLIDKELIIGRAWGFGNRNN